MLGTLRWRLQEAFEVFIGRKKTQAVKTNRGLALDSTSPEEFLNAHLELKILLESTNIEFCFSEFGENRVNAGGSNFVEKSRLDPSLSSLKKYFPNAKFTVYSDFDLQIDGVNLIKCTSPIPDKNHPRYLYRTADYFKFKSLTNSTADFVCVVDSDMLIASPEFYSLIYLTKIFGFCAPHNPRNLLKKDMNISFDAIKITDLSHGLGHSYNQSPMTLWKNDERGKLFYTTCAETMQKDPSRASLVMWKAAWKTGIYPYILPKQWCICDGNEGIGNEVILHVGHKSIKEYYNDNR